MGNVDIYTWSHDLTNSSLDIFQSLFLSTSVNRSVSRNFFSFKCFSNIIRPRGAGIFICGSVLPSESADCDLVTSSGVSSICLSLSSSSVFPRTSFFNLWKTCFSCTVLLGFFSNHPILKPMFSKLFLNVCLSLNHCLYLSSLSWASLAITISSGRGFSGGICGINAVFKTGAGGGDFLFRYSPSLCLVVFSIGGAIITLLRLRGPPKILTAAL